MNRMLTLLKEAGDVFMFNVPRKLTEVSVAQAI